MKVVETRIRVETSKHKTEYFPEYCLESKSWFGKVKREWFGICDMSSHDFGQAYVIETIKCRERGVRKYNLEWAQRVIDYQAKRYKEQLENEEHGRTKETTYVKYP